MRNKTLVRITTVPSSLDILLRGQLKFLSKYFNVIAVSSPGTEMDFIRVREGVHVREIKMMREISILSDFISLFKLFFFLIKVKPYIIHSNTPKSSLLSMVAGYFAGVTHRIYNVTGLRFESAVGYKRWLLVIIEKITCQFATVVVAESIGVKQLIRNNNISQKEIKIIGNGNINGIDISFWNKELASSNNLFKKFPHLVDKFVFIFVGRIVRDKGIIELVNSFLEISKKHSKAHLLLVGRIEENHDLPDDILSVISLNGHITHVDFQDDVRDYFYISHCLILPSYREGFPNVILQAGSFGLPVIMTDVCGSDEYLFPFNGVKISKKSKDELIDAMDLILFSYNNFDKVKIHNFVKERFSSDFLYVELLKFYNSL